MNLFLFSVFVLIVCLYQVNGVSIPVHYDDISKNKVVRDNEYYISTFWWPSNGVPTDNYPSYEERSMGTWINTVCIYFFFVFFLFFLFFH